MPAAGFEPCHDDHALPTCAAVPTAPDEEAKLSCGSHLYQINHRNWSGAMHCAGLLALRSRQGNDNLQPPKQQTDRHCCDGCSERRYEATSEPEREC